MRRILFVTLLLLVVSCAAAAQPLAVKEWVRFPEFRSVLISPKGTYIAVVSSPKNSDRYQLVILKTAQVLAGKPKVLSHFSLREYEKFAGVRWVNNKRILGWTEHQFGGLDRPNPDGNLYAVNANGSEPKALMGRHGGGQLGYRTSGTNKLVYFAGVLTVLPKEPNIILVEAFDPGSNVPMAYRVDTFSDTFFRIATGLFGGGMLADHDGVVRFAWGSNEETGVPEFKYRPRHSMKWESLPAYGDVDRLAAEVQDVGGPIMFGSANKEVYYNAWSDNKGQTSGLYEFDPDTGKGKLLFLNNTVDVGIGEFPDTNPFIKSFDGKSIVGLRIMPGKIEIDALDAKAPRIQLLAALQNTFPGKAVVIVSHTRDGSESIVKVWGDTTPATYYLYASKPRPSLTPIFAAAPWIKAGDLSPMKPITYKARDGLTIHGYLTIPRGDKPKNLPLVIYVHGGPHGIRYDWGFDDTDFDSVATQILANHGYAVLAPNYRGSGGYGFKFEEAGFRHWGDTMQDDLADAANWAVSRGIADPKRICILGASYGGYAALMSAERFPNLYRCAVGYDGVYDLTLQKTRKAIAARFAGGRLYLNTVLGDDHKQLVAFSPAFNANSLKAAVFLLQGGRDQIAPVKGYDEMVAAIRKHGTPLTTLYERNEGHGFYKPAHRAKAWTDILAFLHEYIGAGTAN